MLVLSRKREEGIIIDGDIEIKIIEIDEGRVRLGITAPKHKEIIRTELYNKVQNENKEAISEKTKIDKMKEAFSKKQD